MNSPIIPPKRYFVGFSTQNSTRTGVSTLYDIDLINADLMAAFQTRVGERVMRPNYGCRLWDYLMEPFSQYMAEKIIAEATRICELDARCTVMNVQIAEANQGFRIEVLLAYQPWNVISTFSVSFQKDDSVYYGTSNSNILTTQ